MKMFQGATIVCTLLLTIGLLFSECNARHGMDRSMREVSISCYECNSEYDPRCRDPFDSYTIGVVNCSMKKPLPHINEKPKFCRKSIQKVQGNIRVIRGCGYVEDEKYDKRCIQRSGTHDVNVMYCSCKSSLCNVGHKHFRPLYITAVLGASITILTSLFYIM